MRKSTVLGSLLFIWLIVVAAIPFLDLKHTEVLSPSVIRHESGCAYMAVLSRPVGFPLTAHRGDRPWAPTISDLQLKEDGAHLGPPHSLHDDIRLKGAARYSHWQGVLYFSSPDCSDPRSNGRTYEVTASIGLSTSAIVASLLAAVGLGFIIRARWSHHRGIRFLFGAARNTWVALLSPTGQSKQRWIGLLVLIALMLASATFLVSKWTDEPSQSVLTSAGRASNPSDGMGYWVCANALLDIGRFGNESSNDWCQRRSTYPSFLASATMLGGQTLFGALLVQAFAVMLAIYCLFRVLNRYISVLGGLICAALLYKYAEAHSLAFTLTENAGLVFGCVGFASLILASSNRSLGALAMGIAMLSIALNARAGAFFILPFLVLWAGFAAHRFSERVWLWVATAAAASLVGFVTQALMVLSVGGDPTNSHGNFSYVLYGMAVGGKGWMQVITDHPEIYNGTDSAVSKAIYALAWEQFKSQPTLFLSALLSNLRPYFLFGSYGGIHILGLVGVVAHLFWWLAWIPIGTRLRNPTYSLIGFVSLGVAISSPFLIADGGPRVFAASVAADAVQISLGFLWACSISTERLTTWFKNAQGNAFFNTASDRKTDGFGLGLATLLVMMLLIPHTPLRHLGSDVLHTAEQCASNEDRILTNVGTKGSLLLDIVADGKTNFFRGEISDDRLFMDVPDAANRARAIESGGMSLLAAQQLDVTDKAAPGPYWLYAPEHLSEKYFGLNVRLCVEQKESFALLGQSFRRINSIDVLNKGN